MFLMVSFCCALLLVHFLYCSLLLTSSALAWVSSQAMVPSGVLRALAWESGSSTGHSPFGRVPVPACVPPWDALTSRVVLALACTASFQESSSSHLPNNAPFHVFFLCVSTHVFPVFCVSMCVYSHVSSCVSSQVSVAGELLRQIIIVGLTKRILLMIIQRSNGN